MEKGCMNEDVYTLSSQLTNVMIICLFVLMVPFSDMIFMKELGKYLSQCVSYVVE